MIDFVIPHGRDWSREIQVRNAAGDPTAITGWTAGARMMGPRGEVATITATVTDAANGKISVGQTDTDCAALQRTSIYELEVWISSGSQEQRIGIYTGRTDGGIESWPTN